MTVTSPRSGYTLPVFACAAAVAALGWLREKSSPLTVTIDLVKPARQVEIAIAQLAGLQQNMALAITYSDPGDNLDLTRNTPIWAVVEWQENSQQQINIVGGEGVGRILSSDGKAAIYTYAQELFQVNLSRLLKPTENIKVTIILPEGRALAERTSNTAFGVVEGLSLLGTTGISQPLSAPGQLEACLEQVRIKAKTSDRLVFCIGENGLDLAQQLGINPQHIVKTANWIGPVLVEAASQEVKEILLFGYHGKLIKLAGGIFHTHHHLADGRLEILTAYAAQIGLPTPVLQTILASSTTESALKYLQALDTETNSNWVQQLYSAIANTIDKRAQEYIFSLSDRHIRVGSILFDRDRAIITQSQTANTFLC
ncbi:cobalt-precorrin-5B (C(1))-methyltransferase CbiD [Aliterella atlantica]|uniref:Cobalt-precorrin-5B C(1)-methyltransferase n=1 Tax=Aliterella atlantica CENA595 TaxID=1618023 RepID=A0A0D8ZWU8_9CYAN|nr:cobalt-precorrin-5B (C(1))-methyltransferase CbiD [Aliterella atlantica]KJH72877.1 cobalt-precorrin-6A synthase [Aliterella atlantica CENA595]